MAYLGERDDKGPCIAGCRRRGLLSHLRRADLSGSCDAVRVRRAPTAWQEDLPSTVLEGPRMCQDRSLPVACSKKALTFVTSTEPRNCEHHVGSFDVNTFLQNRYMCPCPEMLRIGKYLIQLLPILLHVQPQQSQGYRHTA